MDERIYLIMDYCSGGDLSFYIKKRGRLPTLEYVPPEGGPKRFWIHPEEGGLDEVVVKCFLGQLSTSLFSLIAVVVEIESLTRLHPALPACSVGAQVPAVAEPDPPRHQAPGACAAPIGASEPSSARLTTRPLTLLLCAPPQNLLLQPPSAAQIEAGHPVGIPILKVADFGFARFLDGASMAETLCGSPCVPHVPRAPSVCSPG